LVAFPSFFSADLVSPYFYTFTHHARQRLASRHIPDAVIFAAFARPPIARSIVRAYYAEPVNDRTAVVVVVDPLRRLVLTIEYRRLKATPLIPH